MAYSPGVSSSSGISFHQSPLNFSARAGRNVSFVLSARSARSCWWPPPAGLFCAPAALSGSCLPRSAPDRSPRPQRLTAPPSAPEPWPRSPSAPIVCVWPAIGMSDRFSRFSARHGRFPPILFPGTCCSTGLPARSSSRNTPPSGRQPQLRSQLRSHLRRVQLRLLARGDLVAALLLQLLRSWLLAAVGVPCVGRLPVHQRRRKLLPLRPARR